MSLQTLSPATRTVAAACAAALVLITTGCSDDSDDSATADASTVSETSAGSISDDPGEEAEDLGEAVGNGDFSEAVEGLGEETLADALGYAITSVMERATSYELTDGVLVVQMEGSSADGGSDCTIATIAADGVGSTTPIRLSYADEDVDCE